MNLVRIPAHIVCNRSFQFDEDYFFTALVPIAAGLGQSSVANSALAELRRAARRPQGARLIRRLGYDLSALAGVDDAQAEGCWSWPDAVLTLTTTQAEGLWNTLEHHRLERVAWKIVRGFSALSQMPLRESSQRLVEFSFGARKGLEPDTNWHRVSSDPSGVFSFAYAEPVNSTRQKCLLKFWEQIAVAVTYDVK